MEAIKVAVQKTADPFTQFSRKKQVMLQEEENDFI